MISKIFIWSKLQNQENDPFSPHYPKQFSIRAFKHFKRSDFNSPALAKKTVDSMSKVGVNWMFITGEVFYMIWQKRII